MTLIEISHYTEEEINNYYAQLSEAEKKEVVVIEYDFDKNWEKWEKIKDRFPNNRFLLFKRDTTSDGKISNVYLVDTLQTACVLQENYQSFRYVVGSDFDPMTVVYEVQDPNSEFWNKVLDHSALLGILFGFGPKNSWPFQWKYERRMNCLKDFRAEFSDSSLYRTVSMGEFPIPIFAIFNDREIVDRYKKEREEIKKIYKGKDFLALTLRRLTE